jgi:hypothetical protein
MMKKITNQKMIRVLAICMLFLSQSYLMAQSLPLSTGTQTVCINSNENYEVVPTTDPVTLSRTSTYSWSIIDNATLLPPTGILVPIITTPTPADDWWIEVNWPIAGTYTLSVMETNNAIPNCSSNLMDLIVTVEPEPLAPDADDVVICVNNPNPTLSASIAAAGNGVGVFTWYDLDPTDPSFDPAPAPAGNEVGTGASFTPTNSTASAGFYSYWVTDESANTCEGPATQVTVTITVLPSTPVIAAAPFAVCFGLQNPTFIATVGNGGNYTWYDATSTPRSLLVPNPPPTPNPNNDQYISTESAVGVYTYEVEETISVAGVTAGCTSLPASFTFEIYDLPASPTVSPNPMDVCEELVPGTTPNPAFLASTNGGGFGFTWYDVDPTTATPPATPVGSSSSLTPTEILAGSYSYWVTEDDVNGCVSTPTEAIFNINEKPLQPDVTSSSSTIICVGGSYPTLTANQGAGSTLALGTFTWYNLDPTDPSFDPAAAPAGNGVGTLASLTPTAVLCPDPASPVTALSSETYSFWVTETSPGDLCEGPATVVTFTIHAKPAAPTYTNNPHEICFDASIPAFTAPTLGSVSSGADLIWYDDITLTNQVGTGASYTPGSGATPTPVFANTYSYWVVDQLVYPIPNPSTTCTSLPLQIDLEILPLPTTGPIYHN